MFLNHFNLIFKIKLFCGDLKDPGSGTGFRIRIQKTPESRIRIRNFCFNTCKLAAPDLLCFVQVSGARAAGPGQGAKQPGGGERGQTDQPYHQATGGQPEQSRPRHNQGQKGRGPKHPLLRAQYFAYPDPSKQNPHLCKNFTNFMTILYYLVGPIKIILM